MSDQGQDVSDAMPVARVYAQALWNLAHKQNVADELLAEYGELITGVLDKNPMIEQFLAAATIGRDTRKEALTKAIEGKVSDLLLQFLLTLNRHDRMSLVRLCGHALVEMADEARGVRPVEVRSAKPLSPEQENEVKNVVRKRFGIEPRLQLQVDPGVLGGLWLRVGDTVLDRTLKTNLRKLRDVIRTRNTHEIQSGRSYFDTSS